MNNGQPPYGDPSAWGQPGQGQVPVQQPYQQPYPGQQMYPQQQHPQQQVVQQQTWQPYQQPYQQPAQGGYPQQGAYQQPYVQPGYQQPLYGEQQPGVQYPQQGYPQQGQYTQFNAQGQQMDPRQFQGYTGYRSQPSQKGFSIPYDVVVKVVLYGVLPVLFLISLLVGGPVLKWVFLAADIAGIVMLWMRDVLSPNLRLVATLLCGVAGVVALVGALTGQPGIVQSSPDGGQPDSKNPSAATAAVAPSNTPTYSPDPYAVDDPTQRVLESFFYYWHNNNDDGMLTLCAPSWRSRQENASEALFRLRGTRVPLDDYEVTVSGSPDDAMRTATVKVTIDKKNGRPATDRYAYKIIMLKEDGVWYVDPQSLKSNEAEVSTATPATENTTPTQPPLNTGFPNMVLYYNKDGGSKYHLDPDCKDVNAKYKPMAQFYFSQLNESPYSKLNKCNTCGAPMRESN